MPGVPNDAIGAAGELGKVSVSEPSASSGFQVRLLRSEDTVAEMVKSIFPKGCNRTYAVRVCIFFP